MNVTQLLRTAIVTGKFKPGSRLVQEDVAARYGISRIPLREALRTLESEGLVVMRHNHGAFCRPLDAADVSNLFDVRLALETVSVRTAAELPVDLRVATKRRAESAKRADERGDRATVNRLDADFHLSISRAGGNAHLTRALELHWPLIMRAAFIFLSSGDYCGAAWKDHLAIADAVAAGDVAGAVGRITDHVEWGRSVLLRRLADSAGAEAVAS